MILGPMRPRCVEELCSATLFLTLLADVPKLFPQGPDAKPGCLLSDTRA